MMRHTTLRVGLSALRCSNASMRLAITARFMSCPTNRLRHGVNNNAVDHHIDRPGVAKDLSSVLPGAFTGYLAVLNDAPDRNPWLSLCWLALLFQRLNSLCESR